MALAVESATVQGAGLTNALSIATSAFALSTSNILIAVISMGDGDVKVSTAGGSGVGIVWNTSESFTPVPSGEAHDANFCSVRLYYLLNPTATTSTVSATWPADTIEKIAIHVIGFSGADVAGTPLGAATTDGADVGSNPDIVVSSAAGNIVVSALCTDASGTTTNGGTTIANFTLGSDTDHYAQYQTASGASTTCSWTSGAEPKAMAGVAVKAAGGGGGGLRRKGSLGLLGVGR